MKINSVELINKCELLAQNEFSKIDEIALFNQKKVMDAFRKNHISSIHFQPSNGYGYDDVGRDTLNKVFADIFLSEASIVSPLIANGTHALTTALFGLLRPNDLLVSITDKPYDTLDEVINGKNVGSLSDYGVSYMQVNMKEGDFDYENVANVLKRSPKLIFIQRSKGYLWRDALSIEKIEKMVNFIRNIDKNIIIMVDNCYGEFVETREPIEVGVDVVVGSLTKNIGGGLAPTGGYIAGKSHLITQISYRLTAPGLGLEVGSYYAGYLSFYQGLFLAPSTVKNALKGNILAGYVFNELNYTSLPKIGEMPTDIIRSIKFNKPEELIKFCQIVQKCSPIDSHVVPEPWDMPGYTDQVIMAAGTFVQGASLELTADGTVRFPYVAYLQGGLTYEHVKIALQEIIEAL